MVRLLRTGKKMQAILGRGHQTIQQRGIQTMQILDCVGDTEAGTQIEMKLSMAYQRKVDENNAAVGLLQGYCRIHGGGSCSRASLGAKKGENAGFAHPTPGPRAIRTETCQGLQ